ncbi:MAG: U32 family peptidase, partial [Bdellovibrionales bacterium]|nr:U32 family peptidase [Bdellovibrionales bacterium]
MAKNSLELLMPAGSSRKMRLALDYGADAVYLGPPLYSLRARTNDFNEETLRDAITYAHDRQKKVYMTLNIFSRNRKIQPFTRDITTYASMKPDAFIISDPGLAAIAKELAPEIPIHLSVQANCMNWRAVKFWQQSLGVERVILSRELSITEIATIKDRVPDMELEAFVHGSICIAYSGRCLLSSYMNRRDANQGVCDNSCREKYRV